MTDMDVDDVLITNPPRTPHRRDELPPGERRSRPGRHGREQVELRSRHLGDLAVDAQDAALLVEGKPAHLEERGTASRGENGVTR